MVATMYAADGVGLAACQIGVDLAVFVFDCPDATASGPSGVVCNPVVTLPEGRDRQLDDDDEGCLSLPGALVPLRPPDVRHGATGTGLDGEPVTLHRRRAARPLPPARDRPHAAAPSSATGCRPRWRKKLQKAHEQVADDYPDDWPAVPAVVD